MPFDEDRCQVRSGSAPQTLFAIRTDFAGEMASIYKSGNIVVRLVV